MFEIKWYKSSIRKKKMSEKSVFRETSRPAMVSQSFPVSILNLGVFYSTGSESLRGFLNQNTGKKNDSATLLPVHVFPSPVNPALQVQR